MTRPWHCARPVRKTACSTSRASQPWLWPSLCALGTRRGMLCASCAARACLPRSKVARLGRRPRSSRWNRPSGAKRVPSLPLGRDLPLFMRVFAGLANQRQGISFRPGPSRPGGTRPRNGHAATHPRFLSIRENQSNSVSGLGWSQNFMIVPKGVWNRKVYCWVILPYLLIAQTRLLIGREKRLGRTWWHSK